MEAETLKQEIDTLPADLRREVGDFVAFLKAKYGSESPLTQREFGFAKGRVRLSADFDAPLDDFREYQ